MLLAKERCTAITPSNMHGNKLQHNTLKHISCLFTDAVFNAVSTYRWSFELISNQVSPTNCVKLMFAVIIIVIFMYVENVNLKTKPRRTQIRPKTQNCN